MPRSLVRIGTIIFVGLVVAAFVPTDAHALCDSLPTDTLIFIDVNDTIATPGAVVPVSIFLQNTTDTIQALQMIITLSRSDLLYFEQDTVIDTCYICLDSACTMIDTALCTLAVVGYDTVGAMVNNWEYVEARTFTTVDIRLTGISDLEGDGLPIPILPNANGLLLKVVGKMHCEIPDTLSDRTVVLTPNSIGTYFSDPDGCLIRYVKLTTGSVTAINPMKGDLTGDFVINVLDVVYIIDYVFRFGPSPCPLSSANLNCDIPVNVLDVVYLIDYVFRFGPPPMDPCP